MRALIAALRKAADTIKTNPDRYQWTFAPSCNCGWLARCLLSKSAEDIRHDIYSVVIDTTAGDATYTCLSEHNYNHYCSVSNMPVNNLFRLLHEAGLSVKDIGDLEYLRNEEVLNRAGINTSCYPSHFKDYHNVVLYMQTWADMLEERSNAEDAAKVINEIKVPEVNKFTVPKHQQTSTQATKELVLG